MTHAIETVKTLLTALQANDLELAANTLSDDFQFSGFAPKTLHKNEFLALQSELHSGMPDFSYNPRDIRLDDQHAATQGELRERDVLVRALIHMTGTQTADLALPLFGLPVIAATGLALILPETSMSCTVMGKLVSAMHLDPISGGGLSGLLQQSGAELPLEHRTGNVTL